MLTNLSRSIALVSDERGSNGLPLLFLSQVGLIYYVGSDKNILGYLLDSDLVSCMQIVALARVAFLS